MIKFVHLSFRLSYQVHLLLEDAFEKKNKKTKGECSSIVYIYIYIYIHIQEVSVDYYNIQSQMGNSEICLVDY
jgi:hypothetical protein